MAPLKWLTIVLVAAIWSFFAIDGSAVTVSSPSFQALTNAIASSTNVQLTFDGVVSFPSQIIISRQVSIDASNHNVTFQGGGNRFFYVTNGGDLTLSSITLSGGTSPNREPGSSGYGGAIFLTNASLTMNKCTVKASIAQGVEGFISFQTTVVNGTPVTTGYSATDAGSGFGGAIYASVSRLTLKDCFFENNFAGGKDALFKEFYIYNVQFKYRVATVPGVGSGGAIDGAACQVEMTDCVFRNNKVSSGKGFTPLAEFQGYYYRMSALGAAANIATSIVNIRASSFVQNSMVGGPASNGGGLAQNGGYLYLENTSFSGNSTPGHGGALSLAATCVIDRCSFVQNMALAQEPRGGAGGGAISTTMPLTIDESTFVSNRTVSGDFELVNYSPLITVRPPAAARGGAVVAMAGLSATNCIFLGNSARTGAGHPLGLSPPAGGGAVAVSLDGKLVHCSFASNLVELADYPNPSLPLIGSAVWADGKVTLIASALSGPNTATLVGGTNTVDGGFNVIGDGSLAVTESTTLTNTDPQLRLFSSAGFSILRPAAGSPAIDRVTVHLTDYDIRGMLRPQSGSDSGAVELGAETPLTISAGNGSLNISAPTFAESLRLLGSSDLKTWVAVGPTNVSSFNVPLSGPQRFFKLQFDP